MISYDNWKTRAQDDDGPAESEAEQKGPVCIGCDGELWDGQEPWLCPDCLADIDAEIRGEHESESRSEGEMALLRVRLARVRYETAARDSRLLTRVGRRKEHAQEIRDELREADLEFIRALETMEKLS